jgi:thiol-disulfide isomerase/thioredoxin
MNRIYIFALFIISSCTGTTNSAERTVAVQISFLPSVKSIAYLEKLSFTGKETMTIDSAELNYDISSLHFKIKDSTESVYQLRIQRTDARLYFTTDVDTIKMIVASGDWKTYHFANRGGNNLLAGFITTENQMRDSIGKLVKNMEKAEPAVREQWMKRISALQESAKKNAKTFADTVTSAGAFLVAYNRIEFGKDFNTPKQMLAAAAKRFPSNPEVQKLNEQTIQYASIFEEEYNIGDRLPDITLPDYNGNSFSLHSLKGKYVFIDFWSSWCPPCFEFIDPKKKLRATLPGSKLEVVNIALDAEKAELQRIISSGNVPGIHLIDTEMWRGKAAYTSKIDSIPFNFLIGPDGRVLAKALKKDSVLSVVTRIVK